MKRRTRSLVLITTALLALACREERIDQSRVTDSARFGQSVAITNLTAAVGAYTEDGSRGSVYVFARTGGDAWSAAGRVTSPSPSDERFGDDVALSSTTLVVGAPRDNHFLASRAGSVYVFERDGTAWTSSAQLSPGARQAGEAFGDAVAIDGETIVVGAAARDHGGVLDAGAAFVFTRTNGTWSLAQTLTAPAPVAADGFGTSVAIAGDTIAVGAVRRDPAGVSNAGAVLVYRRNGATWALAQSVIAADPQAGASFGSSVALAVREDGSRRLVVGAAAADAPLAVDAGAAYVLDAPPGAAFVSTTKLGASAAAPYEAFGSDVALSGDRIVIGAPGSRGAASSVGAAYVFALGAQGWSQVARLDRSAGDARTSLGASVAIVGPHALIGAPGEEVGATTALDGGAVHAFREGASGAWAHGHALHAQQTPPTSRYGAWIALGGDVAVAASRERADAFASDLDGLSLVQPIDPLPGTLLSSVATDGESIAMFGGRSLSGNAYGYAQVLVPSGEAWAVEQLIEPDLENGTQPDEKAVGGVVSILGDTLVIGAPRWNGGDGRVFVYTRSAGTWSLAQGPIVSPYAATNFDRNFGEQVRLDGDTLVIAEVPSSGNGSTTRHGSVHVYVRAGAGPYELQQVISAPAPSDMDGFGEAIAISGDLLAVLDDDRSVARVYRRTAGVWSEVWSVAVEASSPLVRAGQLIDLEGDRLVLGAPDATVSSYAAAGEVRVYLRGEGDVFELEHVLRATVAVASRGLGAAVAIEGERVLAGTNGVGDGVYAFPL